LIDILMIATGSFTGTYGKHILDWQVLLTKPLCPAAF
jgi:hypothetical protein